MHGVGKHLAKGEASRVLRHLVTEDILVEDVKKSDTYGSVSSVLKASCDKFPYILYLYAEVTRVAGLLSLSAPKKCSKCFSNGGAAIFRSNFVLEWRKYLFFSLFIIN